jgi:hypothetical protein
MKAGFRTLLFNKTLRVGWSRDAHSLRKPSRERRPAPGLILRQGGVDRYSSEPQKPQRLQIHATFEITLPGHIYYFYAEAKKQGTPASVAVALFYSSNYGT